MKVRRVFHKLLHDLFLVIFIPFNDNKNFNGGDLIQRKERGEFGFH
jgi:hypothetical protein